MLASNDQAHRYRESYWKEIEGRGARADCFVISFPKSGRTWHRALVGTYLARLVGESPNLAFRLDLLIQKTGLLNVLYSHNGANFIDQLAPDDPLVGSSLLWSGRPVLLLVRDPKDVLVSAWHHARYREGTTSNNLATFIRNPRTGIEKVLTAYNRWHANQDQASSFAAISYERIASAPKDALRSALNFIGLRRIDEDIARWTVEQCRFQTMQSREETSFYKSAIIDKRSDDPRARKVREGRIGNYVKFFSDKDLSYIEAVTASIGDPFVALYQRAP